MRLIRPEVLGVRREKIVGAVEDGQRSAYTVTQRDHVGQPKVSADTRKRVQRGCTHKSTLTTHLANEKWRWSSTNCLSESAFTSRLGSGSFLRPEMPWGTGAADTGSSGGRVEAGLLGAVKAGAVSADVPGMLATDRRDETMDALGLQVRRWCCATRVIYTQLLLTTVLHLPSSTARS
jgi:hypothetical protein